MVVVVALDRLSRDAGHLREILLTLDAAGVRLVSAREAIDRATPEGRLQTGILAEFAEFEREKIKARTRDGIRHLDVEGTRRKVAEATDARLAEVRAQVERAERDERKAAERLARVRRDYTDGRIDAEDWRGFRDELESEHAGAEAKVRQLATQTHRVREAAALLTAEDDVLLRVHDLHVAVTSRIRAAATASEAEADVGPLRAALGQVFESVVVRWPTRADFDDTTVFEVPGQRGLFLEPRLRREVFDTDTGTRREQWESLRRVALDLGVDPQSLGVEEPRSDAENNSTGSGVPL